MSRPGTTRQRMPNNSMIIDIRIILGVVLGFFMGSLLSPAIISMLDFSSRISCIEDSSPARIRQEHAKSSSYNQTTTYLLSSNVSQINVPTSSRGAERLPPDIVVSKSDFYLHRLWGNWSEDLPFKQKYLVSFTVGYDQKKNIDAAVKKFSGNFTILLFHYDGRVNEWDEFEWSKQAIHISAKKQTKWWYAKRFLHPDVVAPYEYIFIWDEDLGVEHFDAEMYIKLVQKHGLEISQPAVESKDKNITWQLTKKRDDVEVHKTIITDENQGCSDPHLPPCAAFVEIMAPVFSRDAWKCVWHVIQNDLVHGWGLDFAFRRCVQGPAHEKIGVVDAQWIIHQGIPSLGNQGPDRKGKSPRGKVRDRCFREWQVFRARMENATDAYSRKMGIKLPRRSKNVTRTPG
ncbi:uncharacterized protein LOC109831495 [Asparagus officinalis]|uniref:uncharacterized protein LOC109831495 n=1 Tax=Asparagus officinalis TaxID=4686 RepID=UPI00098E0BCC|nr:uncharacterized protein LOC109831495 [Asparagus officinalis]